MRLIDVDQTIFVPLIDESKGGVKYEVQMTIAEVFDKFFDGVQPEIVDAILVEWLEEHDGKDIRDSDGNIYGRRGITVLEALSIWQKEQEAR